MQKTILGASDKPHWGQSSLGIFGQFISVTLFALLASFLYRLFKSVNEYRARLVVVFVIVQVPLTFIFEFFNITALMIAKGEIMSSFQTISERGFRHIVSEYASLWNHDIRIILGDFG